jgi:hypothetical protein
MQYMVIILNLLSRKGGWRHDANEQLAKDIENKVVQ